jgi:hypothetical protein
MTTRVASVAAQLRSEDPAIRFDGARALRDVVRAYGVDATPALIASVDAAAITFPAGTTPAGEALRPNVFYEVLHDGWRAAATGDPEVAHTWYTAVLDRVEAADPQEGAVLIDTLARDPLTDTSGRGSPYGPLLAAHAPKVLGLLREWADASAASADTDHPIPGDRVVRMVTAILQQATRQDPIIADLAHLAPTLLPTFRTMADWIEIVLDRHPEPLAGLAALIGAAPAGGSDRVADLRGLLRTGRQVDLPALAALLRPYAERWTDDELDTFVREALLEVDEYDEDDDGNPVPSLPVAARRAPTTRAVPEMLLGLGRPTPALADMADALAAASEPPSETAPAMASAPAGVEFADANFKLVVINHLMYERSVLTPKFDLNTFLRTFDRYEIEESGGPIEEVLEYFAALPLTPEHLAHVVELDVEPSLEIWSQIDPGWGGEEDYFDPATYADVALLPNLRKINVDLVTEDTDLSALYERDDIEVTVDD